MRTLNIGHEAVVMTDKVLVVLPPDSAPVKALRKDAKEQGKLIDATAGKTTRSVLVLETGHVVLSSLNPETLERRLAKRLYQREKEDEG